ncbi:MAG: hypothetical protein JWO71_3067 [Candidatus Acidoferrum typicum]|nr:hypothetical protein [Candidatus Acidoferrum typicum]
MFQPIRYFLSLFTLLLLGILLLPRLSSAQVTSQDPNFTPSVLKSGLSVPSGLVFRSPTGDLVLSQNGANQVSLVSLPSGATNAFATQASADEIAVRSSDGLVAVKTQATGQTAGPINFYSSSGTLLGSIPQGNPNGCITGLAFDTSGNLFVAAGPATEVPGGCQTNGWALYEFPQQTGQTPSTTSSQKVSFNAGDLIEGLAFSAAPLSEGSLYAISSTNGNVYQIGLCADCSTLFATRFAQVSNGDSPNRSISGIAIDPLLGDIYISEFTGGDVVRVRPPDNTSEAIQTASLFATGFSNTFGLAFDTNGNLYVNETNAGNLWKFTRNSFATPLQPISKGQTLTFTNPNSAMSDQIQTILIPPSANLNGAAFLQAIFVPVLGTTLDARLLPGSRGDTEFFGGGPVPPGSTCIRVPSASPNPATPTNCLVTVQKCYDANHKPFDICPVREPLGNTDLIQLGSTYSNGSLPKPPLALFLIDFDTPPDNTTLTDITTNPLDCCTGTGGTKSLCSQTFFAAPGTVSSDFSLGPISPITLSSGSGSATVPVKSIGTFNSAVTLGVSDAPPGVTATLNQPSVTPTAGNTDLTTRLMVSVGPFVSASTFTLIVTGTDITSSVVRLASVNVNVCHYASITLSPSTVAAGGKITVTGTLMSCTSTTQTIAVQFTLTGPFNSGACGTSKSVMFTTPPFKLPAGTKKMVSFPFYIPKNTCPGSYTIAATTFVNGTAVDTSAATLTITH